MWAHSDDATSGTTIVTLEKRGGAQPAMAVGQSAALNAYVNKKNVFHTQMGLIGPSTQYPSDLVRGWFKIPRSKQRFGLGDVLTLNIHAQSNGIFVCGFMTFKEQY